MDTKFVTSKRIVYTPSIFARTALIHIQETGELTALKPHTSSRSKLPSFLFFVVICGEGSLFYEGKNHKLITGDCVFIDCMKSYSHTTNQNLWKLQWVHFNSDTMPEIYRKYTERGGLPVFHPISIDPYLATLNRVYSIAESDDYLKDMRINESLATLLTNIMETSWSPENQVHIKRGLSRAFSLQDVKQFVDDNWAKKITLDQIANTFSINKFYLTRIFEKQYGTSIINYILDIRITQAKRMLRFSNEKINYIGKTCGFDDQNYFSRAFKQVEGITPTEYRKLWVQ